MITIGYHLENSIRKGKCSSIVNQSPELNIAFIANCGDTVSGFAQRFRACDINLE